jgi:hypothetical protein
MGYLESPSHLSGLIGSLFIDLGPQSRYNYCVLSTINKGKIQMTTQHEAIVAAYETYIAENEKFATKGVKASAARARKALQEMSKGIKERRKEITAEKEALAAAAK